MGNNFALSSGYLLTCILLAENEYNFNKIFNFKLFILKHTE